MHPVTALRGHESMKLRTECLGPIFAGRMVEDISRGIVNVSLQSD